MIYIEKKLISLYYFSIKNGEILKNTLPNISDMLHLESGFQLVMPYAGSSVDVVAKKIDRLVVLIIKNTPLSVGDFTACWNRCIKQYTSEMCQLICTLVSMTGWN